MRILYVTPDISWPPGSGGEIRKWNLLQGVLAAGETDAIVFTRDSHAPSPEAFAGCRRVLAVSRKHMLLSTAAERQYASTLGRGWLTLRSPLPFEYQGDAPAELQALMQRELDLSSYDVVWLASARFEFALDTRQIPVRILDGDDFSHVREGMLLRNSTWYGAKLWNYLDVAKLWWWERNSPRRFDVVLRCSREDQRRQARGNVAVIPNGTVIPNSIERTPERRILFVGEVGYRPNLQGLEWFISSIWPLIRVAAPEVQLDIAGRNAPDSIRSLHGRDGIHVHGFVRDLQPLYRRASVSVVPLLAGGGTRLKILEALARGVPVVSTTIGAYGIDVFEDAGLARADVPEAFAAVSARWLGDPTGSSQRALRGREFIARTYDWQRIQRLVTELLERYGARSRTSSPPSRALTRSLIDR